MPPDFSLNCQQSLRALFAMNWLFGRYSVVFYATLATLAGAAWLIIDGPFNPWLMSSLALSSLLMVFGIQDYFQTGSAVRANFPVLGRLRYFFESIRPELRQYFWEDDDAELPYSRNQRAMVYQRAKSEFSIRAFGFSSTSAITFGVEGDLVAGGSVIVCDEQGDSEAIGVIINVSGLSRIATDSDGNGVVEDHTGADVECPA